MSWETIGRILGRTPDACRVMLRRYRLIRGLPPVIKVRNRITDGPVGRQIRAKVRSNRRITLSEVRLDLEATFQGTRAIPSTRTIGNFLNENDFFKLPALNKALIHPRNEVKRVDFSRRMLSLEGFDFSRIIWSDETTVRSNPVKKRVDMWVQRGCLEDDLRVNGQVQGGGISVMFWGVSPKTGWAFSCHRWKHGQYEIH